MTAHLIITRELLRQWDACWDDAAIAARVPLEGVHILRVLDAEDVDIEDRIWVGLHAMPEREARLLACDWAEGACALAGWDAAGEATDSELAAAWDAALDAAWDAWAVGAAEWVQHLADVRTVFERIE